VSRSSRYFAFLSYLLSLPGALFVLLARRDDPFAVYHARQSLALAIVALVTPLVWAILAWGLAWIPLIGGALGIMLFALMIAVYVGLLIDWISGMAYALQGKAQRIPLTGPLAIRPPPAKSASPSETPELTAELIERTSISDV
jgi:uncharacterized membrane protein